MIKYLGLMPEVSVFESIEDESIVREVEPQLDQAVLGTREMEKQEFAMLSSYWRAYAAAKIGDADMEKLFLINI
jgi:hypothetical protein